MSLAHTLSLKRGWIWMGVVAMLVVAAGVAWFVQKSPRVDVLELRYAPLLRTLQFSARVATLSRVDVGSTVTGRVAQVRVAEGAQVRRGDVLVQLETEELRAAVTQALASERQAQARLAGLRSTGRTSAQAGLAQADSTLKAAEAELARTQQLVKQGFLSEARLDEVRRAVEVARAQQAGARAQTQANADAGTDVAQAQAQLALASAATAAARARLAQAAVLAPTDARVLTRDVEPGQIVQPGKALMSLALAGPTQLTAQVDERFLDQLQPGQKAAVVADAFADQRFAARVLSIAPAVDAQRGAIEVKFALEQQAPAFLREDMTLSVEVETGRRERALVLPLSALRGQPSPATATVLVADAGRAQERPLRLGLRTLDAAEVLEGLAEGDAVLLGSSVPAGARIRARAVAWAPGQPVAKAAAASEAGSAMSNAIGR
ncbi:MAG: efflux RND transporter periplasmic adaptor subunit [Polaromonas sp.]|uniref:efflux RND transporter periplasmic adaptor subunit n=1 Tax=Polaromonas sp. TaxID=1869339 RepID=UPI0024873147|nr:efflux RND transporter periplasmic adaptor subunit [Polaromonas sp.]MDI1270711.1 efflux RND transporter periplasmic adaptor subunit [Polaromonas sp.]